MFMLSRVQALCGGGIFSLAIYLRAGVKEMLVCKVLSQGIPHFNKTNFK